MTQYIFILGLFFSGCTKTIYIEPKIPILKSFECNLSVEIDNKGGFDSYNAFKLIKCYESMKNYYYRRDEEFNKLLGNENEKH